MEGPIQTEKKQMEAIRTITTLNHVLKIMKDEHPDDPRNWCNLGTMICFSSRYNLGDVHDFDSPSEFKEFINNNKSIVLPLYLYDHSGITISTKPFHSRWDSGQVGYIYVTLEKAMEELVVKDENEAIDKAVKALMGEVKQYDHYITGSVYGFDLKTLNKETGALEDDDSIWGYYGMDLKQNGIFSELPNEVQEAITETKDFSVYA